MKNRMRKLARLYGWFIRRKSRAFDKHGADDCTEAAVAFLYG